MLKTRILLPGQVAVSKAERDKLNTQWAEVQAVLNVDVFDKLEDAFRRAWIDPVNNRTDKCIGFYDGMRFVLDRITALRDEKKKGELPF